MIASFRSYDTSSRTSTVTMSIAFIKVSQYSIGNYEHYETYSTTFVEVCEIDEKFNFILLAIGNRNNERVITSTLCLVDLFKANNTATNSTLICNYSNDDACLSQAYFSNNKVYANCKNGDYFKTHIFLFQHSIGFYFGVQSVDTGNIDSNVSSWQTIPYVEGYLPISACFVGYYNNGSRWIVSNPMEITDNESRITLVRMFNNNDTVSAAKGDLEIVYIKRSLFENLSQFQQVQQ